jgi:hypothetical protein
MIKNGLGKAVPDLIAHRLPRKLARRLLLLLAKFLVRLLAPGETDNRQRGRKLPIRSNVIERGNQFPHREIAGRSENDNAAGLRDRAGSETFAERIGLGQFGRSGHRIGRRLDRFRSDR